MNRVESVPAAPAAVLVSKKLTPDQLLQEYTGLLEARRRHEASRGADTVVFSLQGTREVREGRFGVPQHFEEVARAMRVWAEAPGKFKEQVSLTYAKRGPEILRDLVYEEQTSISHIRWQSQTFFTVQGKEAVIRHHEIKEENFPVEVKISYAGLAGVVGYPRMAAKNIRKAFGLEEMVNERGQANAGVTGPIHRDRKIPKTGETKRFTFQVRRGKRGLGVLCFTSTPEASFADLCAVAGVTSRLESPKPEEIGISSAGLIGHVVYPGESAKKIRKAFFGLEEVVSERGWVNPGVTGPIHRDRKIPKTGETKRFTFQVRGEKGFGALYFAPTPEASFADLCAVAGVTSRLESPKPEEIEISDLADLVVNPTQSAKKIREVFKLNDEKLVNKKGQVNAGVTGPIHRDRKVPGTGETKRFTFQVRRGGQGHGVLCFTSTPEASFADLCAVAGVTSRLESPKPEEIGISDLADLVVNPTQSAKKIREVFKLNDEKLVNKKGQVNPGVTGPVHRDLEIPETGETKRFTFQVRRGKSGHGVLCFAPTPEASFADLCAVAGVTSRLESPKPEEIGISSHGLHGHVVVPGESAKEIRKAFGLEEMVNEGGWVNPGVTGPIHRDWKIPKTGEIKRFTFQVRRGGQGRGAMYFAPTPEASFADLCAVAGVKLLPRLDFSAMSDEELLNHIRAHHLEEHLKQFAHRGDVGRILGLLREGVFQGGRVSHFLRRFSGLETGAANTRAGGDTPLSSEDRRNFLNAVVQSLKDRALDPSGEKLEDAKQLLIRMSSFEFEENPRALLEDLKAKAAGYAGDESLEELERQFMIRLFSETAAHFEKCLQFHDEKKIQKVMKTPPFFYQEEGVRFLLDQKRAILADEAGLGKTYQGVAAAEILKAPKVLWITTASNKETVRQEIFKHSRLDKDQDAQKVQVLAGRDSAARLSQLKDSSPARYWIVNYETLVAMASNHPRIYRQFMKDLTVLVVDEAQMIGDPKSWRSQTVTEIQAPYVWLLSATPYKNRLEDFYPLLHFLRPDRFSSEEAFRAMYLENPEGLQELCMDLDDVMLRRSIEETVPYFEPAGSVSYAEQLEKGARIPRKIRILDDPRLRYTLSHRQSAVIERMIEDFPGWAEAYNEFRRLHGQKPHWFGQLNPRQKFGWIYKATYQPSLFGISEPNPMWEVLDSRVRRAVRAGEKLLLWAFNREILDEITDRYRNYGMARIDGTVRGAFRETARETFQTDDEVPFLAANFLCGGIGLTLNKADTALFVQLPLTYQQLYQAENRIARAIGPQNAEYAKESVRIEFLVPQYPRSLVENARKEWVREAMQRGTLAEQIFERLDGGERLYRWVMGGSGDPADLQAYFNATVLAGIGLS